MSEDSISQRYAVGERVLIRDLVAETGLSGHYRAPAYARGKTGIVERCCGAFARPETLAYHEYKGPTEALYRVRIAQRELWGDAYRGAASDSLEIEVYEGWLTNAA